MQTNNCFEKSVDCPVCNTQFKTTKIKHRTVKAVHIDSDYCGHFNGINPYYYDITCCPTCGYTATDKEFNSITQSQVQIIQNKFSARWSSQDYTGERDFNIAVLLYKQAYYQGTLINKKQQYLGLLALKLSWLYRQNNDHILEQKYLEFAHVFLKASYSKESFDDTLPLEKCAYLIAECARKLGDEEEAISWYSRAFDHAKHCSPAIARQIRNQWEDLLDIRRSLA